MQPYTFPPPIVIEYDPDLPPANILSCIPNPSTETTTKPTKKLAAKKRIHHNIELKSLYELKIRMLHLQLTHIHKYLKRVPKQRHIKRIVKAKKN